jgi:hypothetical protein
MATLNFPSSPSNGQTYSAPNGVTYTFDGVKWISNLVAYGNANVAAYLSASTTGNVGAGNLTVVNNFNSNVISANSFTYANGTSILDGIGGTYSNANVIANLRNLTTNVVTSANVQASYFIGNGAALNLVAGSYSYVFDNTGNLTMPTNGDVIMPGTNSILSVRGTTLLGGYTQVTGYYSTLGVNYPGAGTQHGMTLQPAADNTTAINFLNAAGNKIGSITQTSSTVNFIGDGSGLSNVATKTTGSWTVATGTGTYSITVPINGNYQLWVRCNIPNGIIAYQATVAVTNTNVPVLGTQRAWNYTGGGSPILLTTMPTQIVGTDGAISTAVVSTTTANRFDFVIQNTSGSNQTVYWGYITLD